jgi:hypothetical protein
MLVIGLFFTAINKQSFSGNPSIVITRRVYSKQYTTFPQFILCQLNDW